jgi:hypothetical protein
VGRRRGGRWLKDGQRVAQRGPRRRRRRRLERRRIGFLDDGLDAIDLDLDRDLADRLRRGGFWRDFGDQHFDVRCLFLRLVKAEELRIEFGSRRRRLGGEPTKDGGKRRRLARRSAF